MSQPLHLTESLTLVLSLLTLWSCSTASVLDTAATGMLSGGPTEAAASATFQTARESNFPKTAKISGDCMIREPSGFDSPCSNVTLILFDTDGKEVTRMRIAESGKFSFLAKADGNYRIRGDSTQVAVSAESDQIVHAGDIIKLYLVYVKH